MKKKQIVLSAAVLCGVFLLCQFLLHHLTAFTLTSDHKSAEDSSSLVAVKTFSDACLREGIPVFVIEPRILEAVVSNSTVRHSCSKQCPSWCRFLCTDAEITTFGVLDQFWKKTSILTALSKQQFSTITFNQQAPDLHARLSNTSGVTHCILRHSSGHVIHLVVFYQRGDERFLWHSSLPDLQHLDLTVDSIQFGRHEGAYNSLELVKVLLDDVRLRVPKHIPEFLAQMHESHFIDCHLQQAAQFQKEFGSPTDDDDAKEFTLAARDVLSSAKAALDQLGIRFWISSGTCLGWFRQCDLIPYSKDVDIGIWIADYEDGLISSMQNNGLELIHQFGKVEDSFELSFAGQGIKLDIFFFYEETDYIWNGGTQARTGKKFKYIFPKFTLCWTLFLSLKLRVPCDTLSYVEANYGTNWFEPVTSWDWKKNPSNVQENGEWPEEEWHQVIQQFN